MSYSAERSGRNAVYKSSCQLMLSLGSRLHVLKMCQRMEGAVCCAGRSLHFSQAGEKSSLRPPPTSHLAEKLKPRVTCPLLYEMLAHHYVGLMICCPGRHFLQKAREIRAQTQASHSCQPVARFTLLKSEQVFLGFRLMYPPNVLSSLEL